MAEAGIALQDLSFAEVHDCFTIAELIEYEAMGLAAEGQGARVIAEGTVNKDGALPINPSGGLKAKGHPIGATGVSMHALASMQLTGTAGDMQVKNAKLGGIFNMGGTAVANYVSILERLRWRRASPVSSRSRWSILTRRIRRVVRSSERIGHGLEPGQARQ